MKNKKIIKIITGFICFALVALGVYNYDDIVILLQDNGQTEENVNNSQTKEVFKSYNLQNIPEYSGDNYIIINNNIPDFKKEDKNKNTFEYYGDLDSLGRCSGAYANISKDLIPTEKRGSIGMIKPSGWHTIRYDNVDGKYLYNRCHLIGYQLTGENANEKNLITCTRQMNTEGMLDFENKVADYIEKTNNHVLYRVTPIFKDDNLLASGVQMEAYSVEDDGQGIQFNVFVYNVQNGIEIDYTNGESKLKDNFAEEDA